MTVFDSHDYKTYLLARAGKTGTRSGMRSGIAQAAGCNTGYVSQVLNGQQQFSLEQAQKLSAYLGHTDEETHFFLLLVQHARAGTPALKRYFESQIEKHRKQRLNIRRRLSGAKKGLTEVDQATYYSAWPYAAIHVALTVPELRTADALARYFALPLARVRRVLEFLTTSGLAVMKDGRFETGPTYIHLGRESAHIYRHHANWRLRALELLERHGEGESELHYAAAISLSRKDAYKIKDMIIEAVQSVNQKIAASKEEEVFCFNVDFFGLGEWGAKA